MSHTRLPRVLIEDWLPAAAIGVECMRERGSASALAPHVFLHVWWARRPLTVSRAAVLGSLLPADFPRASFERLLGFGHPGDVLVKLRARMDSGEKVEGGFGCDRAFKHGLAEKEIKQAHHAIERLWGPELLVIDPMAGGGSIPLEAARLGLTAIANEYNPVACTVLEATVDYPFRLGAKLGERARFWGRKWIERCEKRVATFYPKEKNALVHAYIFARTVPCPDTDKHPHTPLVPDWHLLNPKGGGRVVVAVPWVDKHKGTWGVDIKDPWTGKNLPRPSYTGGNAVSLFTGTVITGDYIKAKAQAGEMHSALYAVAVKGTKLTFRTPEPEDLRALKAAEKELARLRPEWEKNNVIPTEKYPEISSDERPILYGMPRWADMFSPRQLLAMGVLVEELRNLRPEIVKTEGKEMGEAVVQMLALALDKFTNWNAILASWNAPFGTLRSVFDRHDYAWKPTFAEMAPCVAGAGLDWVIANVSEAYEDLAKLPRADGAQPASISLGSATNLPDIADKSITAVVVDPPYADNVQYSELADFFYVWLKRTQGHRRPEWFSRYLCDHTEEAVVNISRMRGDMTRSAADRDRVPRLKTGEARIRANEFYRKLMAESFAESRRVLRDDGVMTVMFTHKKQEAWAALFQSLMSAGFQITATWPVKTESEHSLHQAKKNAAQSTVLLVCRKRPDDAEECYYGPSLERAVRKAALDRAQRLADDGFNPVDQLVGSFGPAIGELSQYAEVKETSGRLKDIKAILETAAGAVLEWRLKRLVPEGLKDIDAESQFVLLCWDVLQAAEFRFNETSLLGKATNRDVSQLELAGLVSKSGDKIKMVPAAGRLREKAVARHELEAPELDLGMPVPKRVRKSQIRKVHPRDPEFRTAIDACHALALAALVHRDTIPNRGDSGHVPNAEIDTGAARALCRNQGWNADSAVARLMHALIKAAPSALWNPRDRETAAKDYPEFFAWHELLEPLFAITPPNWKRKTPLAADMFDEEEEPAGDDETADSGA